MRKSKEYPIWVKDIFRKEKNKLNIPLEVKELRPNCYYMYHSTTEWDKREKRVKRFSKYLGKITPKGLIEKGSVRKYLSVYEYGAVKLIINLIRESIAEPLEKYFYGYRDELTAISLMKLLKDVPIKQMQDFWDKIYLSNEIKAQLSPDTISAIYRNIGLDLNSQYEYFNYFMTDKDYYAFDLSSIFCNSENINLAEKGYNKLRKKLDQINFLMIYSVSKKIPVMLKPMPGSIRDLSSLKHELKNINSKRIVLILDRGFASYQIPEELKKQTYKFILPLKSNYKIIDYNLILRNSFYYRNRGIHWNKKETPYGTLYLFEDIMLRGEMESTFIKKIEQGKKSKKEFNESKNKFGRIPLLTNLKANGKDIYYMFKEKEGVEIAFDSMKNQLEIDKMYLQSTEAVRGYFFIIFNSLFLYYKILNILKQNKLNTKISVSDVLMILSKVYLVDFGHRQQLTEIPKKANSLIEKMNLNPENIFPTNLRS